MKLVILITSMTERGLEVAQSWQDAGAPGVTVIRSHGLYRLQERVKEEDVELPPMIFSMAVAMAHILENVEANTLLVLSVMPEELVDTIVDATTKVLGDLLKPESGVIFVLDVERTIGIRDHRPQSSENS